MTAKVRVVKYAGYSLVVNEKGEKSAHFHTSNNSKYAVWSMLPEDANGPGHSVTFHWFKMAEQTDKLSALKIIMDRKGLPEMVRDMLKDMIAKNTPKEKAPKVSKPKKAKKEPKITVVTVEKTLTTDEVAQAKADNLAKIREAAAKRKAAAA